MKKLFKGGTVVSGHGTKKADILIDGEKIVEVSHTIKDTDVEVIDVSGKLLMPGFIDANTHFNLEACGMTSPDDFYSGSLAALRGGTTTIIDFALPDKNGSMDDGLKLWHEKANGKCCCDYGFHMTIDSWNETTEKEIDDMYAAGISSFKIYMAHSDKLLDDEQIYHVLKKLKEKGGLCGVHCENAGLVHALSADKNPNGAAPVSSLPECRPTCCEGEAVGRILRIAQAVDIPVVILSMTSATAFKEVDAARKRDQRIFVETCPQYLILDKDVYGMDDCEAAKYVCIPPLRNKYCQKILWSGLRHGEIQAINSDHRAFTPAQKEAGGGDLMKTPDGVPGVETRGEIVYTAGVTTRKISLATMCKALSENNAKAYGLYPRKGILAAGSDADIVIYDPEADHILRAQDMMGKAGYIPYEGFSSKGSVAQVWLRGRLAVDHGNVLIGPDGQFIPRGKCAL